jgi:hypothetical protein
MIAYDDNETRLISRAIRLATEIVNHRDINAAQLAAIELRDFIENNYGEDQRRAAMENPA